jgi:hypothetical protein
MRHFLLFVLLPLTFSALHAQKRDTVRIMHYNVLKYGEAGCASLSTKDGLLRTIFDAYQPDILTLNEISEEPGIAAKFRSGTLQYNSAMTPATYSNTNNSNIVNLLFFNADKFGLLSQTAITGNVRDIDVFRLYHKDATSKGDTTDLWCFAAHLKASQGYEVDRGNAANDVVTWLNDHPEVKNYVISGDFNLYSSTEPAWIALTGTATPPFKDPSGISTGWDGPDFAAVHTQSPSDGVNDCAVTGGMDNRFDFILVQPDMVLPSSTISVVGDTYKTYGNDGVSYNTSLDCGQTTSVSSQVCLALKRASDHLPVVMSLSFPAQSDGNDAPYDFIVYDNPGPANDGVLRVKIIGTTPQTYFYDIYDVLGRYVGRGRADTTLAPEEVLDLSIPPLAQGAYFLRLRDNAGNKVTKTVILIP